jgi:putative ABC transport system substrate-binding protein
MRRRDFITLLGGAAAGWPLVARAQQGARIKRLGVLVSNEVEFRSRYEAFRDRFSQLGWTEQRNIRIDFRSSDNKPDLLQAYARELVDLAPDVLLACPGPVAEAVQQLTRTIPIVFVTSTDPVEAGYAQSFAHPGGNMTGLTNFEASIDSKYLQLLKDVAPKVTRVAVLRIEGLARARRDFMTVDAGARSFGVSPVDLLIKDDAADIARAVGAFASEPNGGLVVPPSNAYRKHRALIVALAVRHGLPAVYNDRIFVEAGGLMSYGTDLLDNFRRAASYVDRILRGEKAADLPVQAPTKFELVINLKTAKTLGLNVSQDMLSIADEVIE